MLLEHREGSLPDGTEDAGRRGDAAGAFGRRTIPSRGKSLSKNRKDG